MLERLREYKELISIIIFFIGGFFWLQTQYPNKSDLKAELASVRCLLNNYMELTQLQIRSQDQDKLLGEMRKKLSEVPPDNGGQNGTPISPAMRAEIDQLKLAYAAKINQQEELVKEMGVISGKLARGVCGRVDL